MTKMIAVLLIFIAALSQSALGQCKCPKEKGDLVFSYEFAQGPKLIICGFALPSNEIESYTNITVMDCRDNQILLSIDAGETALSLNMFRFHLREGRVIIQQIIRLPSERGWQWAPHPFFEKRVSFIDGRLTISEWRNVFAVPMKTQEEIAAFLDAYEYHFDLAGDPMEIPDKLMLCALNGSRRAERFLLEFPKDHSQIFDGALAELYSELLDFYRRVQKK
ncbi:MAG: hypothetical protein IMZ54_06275 [Acidobacteria bacterium]|nr:hypothetical protein [Acidobacteriota bacterium]MBE3130309.1 hypothetical protein [Acidobacteriota bacterium]